MAGEGEVGAKVILAELHALRKEVDRGAQDLRGQMERGFEEMRGRLEERRETDKDQQRQIDEVLHRVQQLELNRARHEGSNYDRRLSGLAEKVERLTGENRAAIEAQISGLAEKVERLTGTNRTAIDELKLSKARFLGIIAGATATGGLGGSGIAIAVMKAIGGIP